MRPILRTTALFVLLVGLVIPTAAKAAPGAWTTDKNVSCIPSPTHILYTDPVPTSACSISVSADVDSGRLVGDSSLTSLGGGTLPGYGSAYGGAKFLIQDFIGPNATRTYTLTIHVDEARMLVDSGSLSGVDHPTGGTSLMLQAGVDCNSMDSGCWGEQKFFAIATPTKSTVEKDIVAQLTVHGPNDVTDGAPVSIEAGFGSSMLLGDKSDALGVGSVRATVDATLVKLAIS